MRKQQQIWKEEHVKEESLPTIANTEPSSSVIYFLKFLKQKNVLKGRALDIGCGKGSNCIYMAQQGFFVYAMDYIKEAIDKTQQYAAKKKVSEKIHTYVSEIDTTWPFANNFFDIAIDCFSSIDIETKEGREIYNKELFRTLKPGGYALITVVSIYDEIEQELLLNNPATEPNSSIWPTGKFQKDYTKEELLNFYNSFTICEIKEVNKRKFKLGREYNAQNFWLIIQKPL